MICVRVSVLLSVESLPSDCTSVVLGISSRMGGIMELITALCCGASIGVIIGCVSSQ